MTTSDFVQIPKMATGKYSYLSKAGDVKSFTKKEFAVRNATSDGAITVYSPTGKIVWSKRS